jgi:hypothetical protein
MYTRGISEEKNRQEAARMYTGIGWVGSNSDRERAHSLHVSEHPRTGCRSYITEEYGDHCRGGHGRPAAEWMEMMAIDSDSDSDASGLTDRERSSHSIALTRPIQVGKSLSRPPLWKGRLTATIITMTGTDVNGRIEDTESRTAEMRDGT